MGTYKNLRGFKVPTYSADPVVTAGWTAGGNMNTTRYQMAAAGTITAAVTGMGATPFPYTANVEEYNGTAWTEVTNHPWSSGFEGMGWCGVQTAALVAGGYHGPPGDGTWANAWLYDGTNWAATGALASARNHGGMCGTSSAGLWAGGQPNGKLTEEFNGSTWSAQTALTYDHKTNVNCGVQTDAITVGGNSPDFPNAAKAEEYNGTSWNTGGLLNTPRKAMQSPAGGTTGTACLYTGGDTGPVGTNDDTETYNGTAWSVGTSLPRNTQTGGGAGTATSYLSCGGGSPAKATTEIYAENSEPNTFLLEGQVWYNSTDGDLKFYDGSAIKTVTIS
jgi:hypothetical protein|tara:strand:- start:126 stop:1127 length:1002 start_codon:yes stop_codon:yes gene_type:complete